MSQLILTAHTGIHDAGAALFRTTESPVEGAARRLNAGQLGVVTTQGIYQRVPPVAG